MRPKDLQSFSDENLLKLVRLKQDHSAYAELYNRYWSKLLAIAYNLTRDKSVSKEVVQELFIQLWNRRDDMIITDLKSYLATAVKYSVFSHIEKERRRRQLKIDKFGVKEEAELDKTIEMLFLKDYFDHILESLPEKCRLVLNYSRMGDLSNAQIAEKMNISEKTVEGHLTKGLKLVRTNFTDSDIFQH